MVAEMTGALDLWTLFVVYVFGSFWVCIIFMALFLFLVMVLGRMSVYSTTWYCALFLSTMAMGYGPAIVSFLITLSVIIGFMFALKSYIDSGR